MKRKIIPSLFPLFDANYSGCVTGIRKQECCIYSRHNRILSPVLRLLEHTFSFESCRVTEICRNFSPVFRAKINIGRINWARGKYVVYKKNTWSIFFVSFFFLNFLLLSKLLGRKFVWQFYHRINLLTKVYKIYFRYIS